MLLGEASRLVAQRIRVKGLRFYAGEVQGRGTLSAWVIMSSDLLSKVTLRRMLVPWRLAAVAFGVAVLVTSTYAIASSSTAKTITLAVSPRVALIGQPVSVSVGNLTSLAPVRVTATTTDRFGHRWRSQAVYLADEGGNVVLADSASMAGTYRGRDGMGLFWSMRELGSRLPIDQQVLIPPAVQTVRIAVNQVGRPVAVARVVRRAQAAGVVVRSVRREGFAGIFYSPANTSQHSPAILFLEGPTGGPPLGPAPRLLASHGYRVLALTSPRGPEPVPLEYYKTALRWLAHKTGVERDRILSAGASLGGQAALLVASAYPSLVHGVIDYGGSDLVSAAPYPGRSAAWSVGGKPIPPGTRIGIERINGPLFLVATGKDPAVGSLATIEDMALQLRAQHRRFTALVYKEAGRTVGLMVPNITWGPNYRRLGTTFSYGGTLSANADARTDSWPKLLLFLSHL
jgi:dienelactone hydrolase